MFIEFKNNVEGVFLGIKESLAGGRLMCRELLIFYRVSENGRGITTWS